MLLKCLVDDMEMADELKEDSLLPKEQFWLVLVFPLVSMLLFQSTHGFYENPEEFDIFFEVTYTLINIFTVCVAYHVNKKGDNKNFFQRYLLLSIPISIQTIILTMIALVGFANLESVILKNDLVMGILLSAFITLITAFINWRYIMSFKHAASVVDHL